MVVKIIVLDSTLIKYCLVDFQCLLNESVNTNNNICLQMKQKKPRIHLHKICFLTLIIEVEHPLTNHHRN